MAAESKIEPARDRTPSSIESTPSPEPEAGGEPLNEPAQPQKRKGGRKPVCDSLLSKLCLIVLIKRADICYLRRAQATQQTSSSGVPRTSNRVHKAA